MYILASRLHLWDYFLDLIKLIFVILGAQHVLVFSFSHHFQHQLIQTFWAVCTDITRVEFHLHLFDLVLVKLNNFLQVLRNEITLMVVLLMPLLPNKGYLGMDVFNLLLDLFKFWVNQLWFKRVGLLKLIALRLLSWVQRFCVLDECIHGVDWLLDLLLEVIFEGLNSCANPVLISRLFLAVQTKKLMSVTSLYYQLWVNLLLGFDTILTRRKLFGWKRNLNGIRFLIVWHLTWFNTFQVINDFESSLINQ